MNAYYAATLSQCQIIRASDQEAAWIIAIRAYGDRLRVLRPATADEIELHETWPNTAI